MSAQFELDNPEEYQVFQVYLELMDVWLDKQLGIITIKFGNSKIDRIIEKLERILKEDDTEKFVTKYFFITGEGWKNYHPFTIEDLKGHPEYVQKMRNGTERFFNPDLDMLKPGRSDGDVKTAYQEVIDDIRKYDGVTEEEIANDKENIKNMEEMVSELEEQLELDKKNQSLNEKVMEELLENPEVKKIYGEIEKEHLGIKTEKVEPTEKEFVEEETKEEREEMKKEEEKTEEVTRDEKGLGIGMKLGIGLVIAVAITGIGFLIKNKLTK